MFKLFLIFNLVFCFKVFAQNITITDDDAYTPDDAAILDVISTSKGVLLPRLTDEQRNAMNNVPLGMLIFNTTDSALQVFIDTSWYSMSMGTPEFVPISDYDGNIYQTIVIGNQEWMAENLRTTHYADGTALVDGTGIDPILDDYTTKYYFAYEDNESNVNTYGRLYTWAAAMNGVISSETNPSGVQGVCPDGWHLPSNSEWTELFVYLGGESVAGGKMKEIGTTNWNSPNTGATDESGFTALPGGYMNLMSAFFDLGNYAYFWSATESSIGGAWREALYYDNSEATLNDNNIKSSGFSVRCTKD